MISHWYEITHSIKSRGVWGTLRWIKNGILAFNIFHVYYLDLKKTHASSPPTIPVLNIRLGSIEELKQLRADRNDFPVEFFCDQICGFSTPFFATVDGKIAAIQWLVFPSEYSRFLNLAEGDVELNYNTVLSEFRGKHIAQSVMSYVVRWSQNAGYKRMFVVVNATNIAQFKPMLGIGFRPVEVLTHYLASRPKATLQYVPK